MSQYYGEKIRLSIFGQSHSKAIGMTLEGIEAGQKIDFEKLNEFLQRRAPGKNDLSTPRKEQDSPVFLCGIKDDVTCGTPITAAIENKDTKSSDYETLKRIPRPGHADYTAEIKYHGSQDYAGGGSFSGRMTAPYCIAGGILKQFLEKDGITVDARIYSIGTIEDESDFEGTFLHKGMDGKYETIDKSGVSHKDFPVVNDETGEKMKELILSKKAEGDSVGGVVECVINGLPAGIGGPLFEGIESKIASAIFAIPAVKGIEFGRGFDAARISGSENNDAFVIEDGKVRTKTNNAGGILGGITDGMPLTFRVAFKPTPSISKEQRSVNLETMEETVLSVPGRHDPCIVHRAVPCVEAAAAVAIYDAMKYYLSEDI